jgi:DNA-binding CsgD family transcriptional regulator
MLPDRETPTTFILLSLHRHREDFSERERTLLNLLLPHVASACLRLRNQERTSAAGALILTEEPRFLAWVSSQTAWSLTRRESEVLFWLYQGKTNSEIGRILGISERTAETHALRVYPKMGVENRYTAIVTVTRLALLQPHAE